MKTKKHIGFTGTQVGMNNSQKDTFLSIVKYFIKHNKISNYHHGDCVGADKDSHEIISNLVGINIWIHPPIIETKRAFCKPYHHMHEQKDYIARNHDIVNSSCLMIATPKEKEEQLRSGTWATIRYATKKKIPVIIIHKNGDIVIINKNIDKSKKLFTLFS